MKQIAIIGPTASGKSDLAIELALKHNCYILSLDSLSIYKEVDIVSAKPTKQERKGIPHFGIDEIFVNEEFNVVRFFDFYKKAKEEAQKDNKNLIIVGGSGFYLKALMDGISKNPHITSKIKLLAKQKTKDLEDAYTFLKEKDPDFAKKISKNDRYRIEKWYEIFLSEGEIPSIYFKKNPPKSILKDIKIFNIAVDRESLKKKISLRTQKMVKMGLLDEIFFLEKKYTRAHLAFKAIGIKESLDYFDGKIFSLNELKNAISTHTWQLAKRQITFNNTQFSGVSTNIKENLKKEINNLF